MNEHAPNVRALWWEWTAARIVVALGILVPVALFLWLTFSRGTVPTPSPVAAPEASANAAQQAQAQAGERLCIAATALAQTYGIVPGFAKPSGGPQESDIRGRYVCNAATNAAKYTIAFDLLCNNLNDARCFNLFNVAQDDGSVLYQRQG